jgi:AcrR family transcriptional regulator
MTSRPATGAAPGPTDLATVRPALPERSARVAKVVAAARAVIGRAGLDGLTMQSVAAELRIKAPSLYKHVGGKRDIEIELIVDTLAETGEALHQAVAEARPGRRVAALLDAYRRVALAAPDRYRLATQGRLPRRELPPGLEAWAGAPFRLATGDPYRGQALWAFAHGMVVLEIDRRFADATQLDMTWAEGAAAFG